MALTNDTLAQNLAEKIAKRGAALAKPAMGSRTLRAATTITVVPGATKLFADANISVPHYWAKFVHDGHKQIFPKRGQFLMWYKDPSRDHRFRVFRPVRLTDVSQVRLSNREFKRRLKAGDLILARSSPARPGRFFFSNEHAMKPLLGDAGEIAKKTVSQLVRKTLASRLNRTDSITATL